MFTHGPLTISVRVVEVSIAPEFIVTPIQVEATLTVTAFPPVVAIITSSPAKGATPPTQVPVAFQFPPVAVEVLVTAKTLFEQSTTIRIM